MISQREGFDQRFEILSILKESLLVMKSVGMQDFVYKEFYDAFIEAIQQLKGSRKDPREILDKDCLMKEIIMFIRLRISAEMQANKSDYIFYFETEQDFIGFCNNEIEPISAEVDEMQISVLFRVFRVPLRIY